MVSVCCVHTEHGIDTVWDIEVGGPSTKKGAKTHHKEKKGMMLNYSDNYIVSRIPE